MVTRTAHVHALAWKEMFDEYLGTRNGSSGAMDKRRFDLDADYHRYVDGKPRYQGVKSFLESRGIHLEWGDTSDAPDRKTICGLGNRKNEIFLKRLKTDDVEVFDTSIDLLHELRRRKMATAVVSSSKNCVPVLEQAGITDLFDVKIDGKDAASIGLKGKPDPDVFLETARILKVKPERAVVLEDSISGVEAGRRGKFGLIIGVNRSGSESALKESGADIVVTDLGELSISDQPGERHRFAEDLPHAREALDFIATKLKDRQLFLCLDFDGTLAPIVPRPEDAKMPEETRAVVQRLAELCRVAVISGRDLRDVRRRVNLEKITFAGSSGFDIEGPEGLHVRHQQGKEHLPGLDAAEKELRQEAEKLEGAEIERKAFSISVHYRNLAEDQQTQLEQVVDEVWRRHSGLKRIHGKKVFELMPKVDWHKGKALLWLMDILTIDHHNTLPIFIGDDISDEPAFSELRQIGVGIYVREEKRRTAARYALENPGDVRNFLNELAILLAEKAK